MLLQKVYIFFPSIAIKVKLTLLPESLTHFEGSKQVPSQAYTLKTQGTVNFHVCSPESFRGVSQRQRTHSYLTSGCLAEVCHTISFSELAYPKQSTNNNTFINFIHVIQVDGH